ncbi:VPS35 endosomal protein-sorting factor-like isoform X3 [Hydra vulgaris]|uniref:VPS35 endosomal protein-sorting factor-like isoform X3 n=1 Tax=Hydra vulgaris TaxID=6087 RepID=A0ABM4CD68_HYDVU
MLSTESYQWSFRKRDYKEEQKSFAVSLKATSDHPLQRTIVNNVTLGNMREKNMKSSATGKSKNVETDPLSDLLFDPLSALLQKDASLLNNQKFKDEDKKKFGNEDGYIDGSFEPWQAKRTSILSKYTTSEKISITSSFLSDGEVEKLAVKQSLLPTEKVKSRLEQLNDLDEGSIKETLNLSQTEYVTRIDELNKGLLSAWSSEQRVKALKIAIQCAKMLGDTDVILFYPSKFVLITDILDNFGCLVFDRIREKSVVYTAGSNTPKTLSNNFTPEEVPVSAKETCQNWFYKVASIRELIPRLYVEMAILKCYSFLTASEYAQALSRLAHQIRGIADPLVAVYARAYLCRVGVLVAPTVKNHLKPCWSDFLNTYKQLTLPHMKDKVQNIDMPTYMDLFLPALNWILQCVVYKASEVSLTEILNECKSCKSSLLLHSVLSAFQPKYIANRALEFIKYIKECEDNGYSKHLLYKLLGIILCSEKPLEEEKIVLLNEVWKVVMKIKEPAKYISCAEVWIEYPLKYLSAQEVNILLGNIIKNMMPDHSFENHYTELLSILSKVVFTIEDFNMVITMNNFFPFLDMFQKDSVKVEASKIVMNGFIKSNSVLSDPAKINSLMLICKTMHNSVSELSLDDDKRIIGNLISSFVLTVTYERDFEKQLEFYVDARASFSNMDTVLIVLIQCVNRLAVQTQQVVKGNHTQKTAAFIRACMAYCFITIPSLMDIFARLKLYLLVGQTALSNQAVGQADGLLRAAIHLLAEVPKTIVVETKNVSAELYIVEYINHLLSVILFVPDHPDHSVLYLVRGLMNVLEEIIWDDSSDAKCKLYLNAICILSAAAQESYIFKVEKVESNDKLYGAGSKFVEEVNKIINVLIIEILKKINEAGEKNKKLQYFICAASLNRIVAHGDLSSISMCKFAQNLWLLAIKNTNVDQNFMKRLRKTIEFRALRDFSGFPELLQLITDIR